VKFFAQIVSAAATTSYQLPSNSNRDWLESRPGRFINVGYCNQFASGHGCFSECRVKSWQISKLEMFGVILQPSSGVDHLLTSMNCPRRDVDGIDDDLW
jgi:hypothetical protein